MDLLTCELPGIPKLRSGKVREIFDLGDQLLIVATDRISAFDCILPNPISGKGEVLTQLSARWFDRFPAITNHLLSTEIEDFPPALDAHREILRGRSMLVKKAEPLPVECVVRGYLAGSGWKDYQSTGKVCGVEIPAGLQLAEQLPEPIFTPATKAETGHDQNISWEKCVALLGEEIATKVRRLSLRLYNKGSSIAAERGIIIADTKFEFGMHDGEVILIDECLTPDSSRFWPAESYAVGSNPPSFDKQFVRDYLESIPWNKMPPAPALPLEVILKTSEKYAEAYELLS